MGRQDTRTRPSTRQEHPKHLRSLPLDEGPACLLLAAGHSSTDHISGEGYVELAANIVVEEGQMRLRRSTP